MEFKLRTRISGQHGGSSCCYHGNSVSTLYDSVINMYVPLCVVEHLYIDFVIFPILIKYCVCIWFLIFVFVISVMGLPMVIGAMSWTLKGSQLNLEKVNLSREFSDKNSTCWTFLMNNFVCWNCVPKDFVFCKFRKGSLIFLCYNKCFQEER